MEDIVNLVPHPQNPNKHPDKQIALLAKIIKNSGWRSPIVISKKTGFIVSGHGRLEAAKLLNVQTVPIDVQEFASEAEEYAHLVADNRIAELSGLSDDKLTELLAGLSETDIDMELTGFDGDELAKLLDVNHEEIEGSEKFSEAIAESNNYVVLVFKNDIDWLSAQSHFELDTVTAKRQNGKPWSKGIGRVIDGASYITKATTFNINKDSKE
tara:strand:+ start:24 stop:659 length:636 start_codon:yes stop_codon:yes gene_type:complete